MPKARPRPGGKRWYVPTQPGQEYVALHAAKYRGAFAPRTELSVRLMFYVSGRRAGDIDNLEKLVLDALQDAGVVGNDMWITECHSTVDRCVKGEDRTAIVIRHRRLPD